MEDNDEKKNKKTYNERNNKTRAYNMVQKMGAGGKVNQARNQFDTNEAGLEMLFKLIN